MKEKEKMINRAKLYQMNANTKNAGILVLISDKRIQVKPHSLIQGKTVLKYYMV